MERMNSLSAIVKALDMEAVYRTMGVFLFAFALLTLADKRNPKRWSADQIGRASCRERV